MLHVLVGLSTMTGGNMNYFWPLGAPRVTLCDSSAVLLFVCLAQLLFPPPYYHPTPEACGYRRQWSQESSHWVLLSTLTLKWQASWWQLQSSIFLFFALLHQWHSPPPALSHFFSCMDRSVFSSKTCEGPFADHGTFVFGCVALSSVFCLAKTSCHGLPKVWICFLNTETPGIWLGFFFWSLESHLICFLSLRDHCPVLSVI